MAELHRLEKRVLIALKEGQRLSYGEVGRRTGLPEDSIRRSALWLSSKNLARVDRETVNVVQLGPEGRRFLGEGLPERILVRAILEAEGRLSVPQAPRLSGLGDEETNIAIGWGVKKGWLKVARMGEKTVLLADEEPEEGPDERLIRALSRGSIVWSELSPEQEDGLRLLNGRPNATAVAQEVKSFIRLTGQGLAVAQEIEEVVEEVSQLTPELIRSGRWRETRMRRYNIEAPVARVWPGKKQPYRRFLDELKWKLVALGFEEMTGPIVELMFFNCDALYMPQDHPAREIHDIYFVDSPSHGDLSEYETLLERVKACHEDGWKTGSRGWGYRFSPKEARRLVLRSQGTALSARTLVGEDLKIPGKYFSVVRTYRPDVVDRTHLTEFNQVEGIVVGEALTFRDLLGVLETFAIEIAEADRVRFRPDYFPFTEPSVELAAYKEGYGWLEFGGAGIFRPEVNLPLGVTVPVIAWGLGVDRLFMMRAGIDDIRELFTQDLDWLRRRELV
ncbi:MAG: phenylalanine--tRNA ligase subunit alpha [Candidatus Bathyarchaeia archaeon]